MKTRRNEPCPCGSGKKYKKCCLKEEERVSREETLKARAAAERPALAASADRRPARELDPRAEARERLWAEFEEADYERTIAIFAETLDDEELMDADLAFEMLNAVEPETIGRGERDRFDALVESVRERRPEIYARNVGTWNSSLITNALAAGRLERVTPLALEMAEDPETHLDMFVKTLDQLAFHDQREALLAVLRAAWPKVEKSDDVMEWAVVEFGNRTIDCEVFDYLESAADPSPDDPELRRRLAVYEELQFELVAETVACLLGRAERDWATVDFVVPRRASVDWVVDEDDEEENEDEDDGEDDGKNPGRTAALGDLKALTLEFLGWSHREHGVPYAAGGLGREEIAAYVVGRSEGDLTAAPAAARPGRRRARGAPKRRSKPEPRAIHPLCPDGATLEHYFADRLHPLDFSPYRVAAAFELMPAWVRYLETLGLIGAEERERTERELRSLGLKLVDGFGRMPEDPTMRERTARALDALGG